MKFMKIAVAAVFAFAYGNAFAFHSGGVAECEGCHSMHNSYEGSANVTGMAQYESGPYLLKAQDQSGACLNCHGAGTTLSSYHISTEGVLPYENATIPAQITPGGDFSWLKKTMTVTIRGSTFEVDGDRHGHNIVAVDFGYSPDKVLSAAPGGSYPAASLACSSCHDPHGRTRRFADGSYATTGLPIRNSGSYNSSLDPIAGVYAVGAYRILGGANYSPKSTPGYPFANQVPDASAPSSYNRAETSQAGQTFVAYGQGMSEWCANCHGTLLMNSYTSGMSGLRHPAGNDANLPSFIVTNYNAYVTSGIMTNVDVNAAYSTLTPFEIGSNDYTTAATGLKARSGLTGAVDRSANAANNVACVSCHRVHASAFESMLRFFYLNEFSTLGDAAGVASYDPSTTENKINYGFSAAAQQQAYNGRPASMFGPYARKACNKCHAKD